MANKWLKQLKSYEDAVDYEYDAKAPENCIYSPSPSFNWIFANKSSGIPRGTGVLLSSNPKAGKSLICQSLIAELHKSDPEAIAIVFNTEMRSKYQKGFFDGIDPERVVMYDTNQPTEIFDRFNNEIYEMIKDGMPLKLLIIDSITNIAGRKQVESTTVEDHLVGDKAQTKMLGLEKMIPICKKHNIVIVGTEQVRANLDMGAGPRAPKTKSAANWFTKHVFEYFITISRCGAAEYKTDVLGRAFEDDSIKDMKGNKDITGHKIEFKMTESSLGVPGRTGILTVQYDTGIVGTEEEVFELGKTTGVISFKPPRSYSFGERTFSSKEQIVTAIKEEKELYDSILKGVIERDAEK